MTAKSDVQKDVGLITEGILRRAMLYRAVLCNIVVWVIIKIVFNALFLSDLSLE